MNSMLILKEKNDKHVVYYYSSDVSDFGGKRANIISDGEIEFIFETEKFRTLKTATFDDDGYRAKWLRPHLWRTIFKEKCPEKRFIATG
jgi:hypothetical protein